MCPVLRAGVYLTVCLPTFTNNYLVEKRKVWTFGRSGGYVTVVGVFCNLGLLNAGICHFLRLSENVIVASYSVRISPSVRVRKIFSLNFCLNSLVFMFSQLAKLLSALFRFGRGVSYHDMICCCLGQSSTSCLLHFLHSEGDTSTKKSNHNKETIHGDLTNSIYQISKFPI